ncbi:MAG: winged helix-turn-helix transcriptional regulator [Nitrososphaerota archaeon]|nr:winged helix-turn-helix transcriptional regulator [Nitrososphaerota archaeon]MDG6975277.1 winged helix-turn-helix transcriptional regulator [Nitrososphaerota archaeon]
MMSSYGRAKVLTVMLETGELNVSEITRRAGLSHGAAVRHLEFLTKSGLITEKRFNRIRIFRVDPDNPLTGALSRFYADWKESGGTAATALYN